MIGGGWYRGRGYREDILCEVMNALFGRSHLRSRCLEGS